MAGIPETSEVLFARYGPRYRIYVTVVALLGTISARIHGRALRQENERPEEVSRRSNQVGRLCTAPLTALGTRDQSNDLEDDRSAKDFTPTGAIDLT